MPLYNKTYAEFGGQLYAPGETIECVVALTVGIERFDPDTRWNEVYRVLGNEVVLLRTLGGNLYAVIKVDGGQSQIHKFDGAFWSLDFTINGVATWAGCVHGGALYIGMATTTSEIHLTVFNMFSLVDLSFPDVHILSPTVTSMVSFLGDLYLTVNLLNLDTLLEEQRLYIYTGGDLFRLLPEENVVNVYAWQSKLYALIVTPGASAVGCQVIQSSNGTVWNLLPGDVPAMDVTGYPTFSSFASAPASRLFLCIQVERFTETDPVPVKVVWELTGDFVTENENFDTAPAVDTALVPTVLMGYSINEHLYLIVYLRQTPFHSDFWTYPQTGG